MGQARWYRMDGWSETIAVRLDASVRSARGLLE